MSKGYTTESFIAKSREKWGDRFTYDKTVYAGNKKKVTITCVKHGDFLTDPSYHLKCGGCRKCSNEKLSLERRGGINEFIEKAKSVHGDRYDYSKVEYVNSDTKVCIICPEHGEFWQTPHHHLDGHGCGKCNGGVSKDYDNFVRKSLKIHDGKYVYNGEYVNTKLKVKIELYDYICSLIGEGNVVRNDRTVLGNKELDIYVPKYNLAIEYDGLLWHSDKYNVSPNYHFEKTNECKKKGIRLLQIFEDEYLERKGIVLEKIRHILGFDDGKTTIGARKCQIKEITYYESSIFLDKYHIQGSVPSSVYIGAYYKDRLISVMTFKKCGDGGWELNRFATDTDYRIQGIASKMFTYFIRNYDYTTIKSFLDRRWNTEGNTVYEKLGFKMDMIERPDYYYVKNQSRYHKFGFRKTVLNRKYGLPLSMSELDMAKELGYHRIWNCGLVKYLFKKDCFIA